MLNVTDEDARGVCEFHGICAPETTDFEPEEFIAREPSKIHVQRSFLSCSKLQQTRYDLSSELAPKLLKSRRSERLRKEDMIRVVHVSDVHFDEKYDPVRPSSFSCSVPQT